MESLKTNTNQNLSHIVPLDFNSVLTLPESHTTEQHPVIDSSSVPVIDLLDPNAAGLIRRASEQWGVFQVTNHGIPMKLMKEAELQARGLFETEKGLQISSTGLAIELVSGMSRPDPSHGVSSSHRLLIAHFAKPKQHNWPASPQGWGWLGAGALVVSVGDLMHILSNGRLKSTMHRAVVNKVHHRISIAYFYGPSHDIKISPSMKLIDQDHPPLYPPVTWKEYLSIRATHFNRALESIRNNVDPAPYIIFELDSFFLYIVNLKPLINWITINSRPHNDN